MCLAIPGKIIGLLTEDATLAMVEVLGVRRKVDLALIQDETPVKDDWVLIHVGFAMSKISEADALQQVQMLMDLGECEAALEEVQGYGLEGASESESRAGPLKHAE
jgi:hydrogenase expression/formation protein HypC